MAITNLTTAQRGSLVELYIAYFNRAPEAGGLTYWSNVLLTKLNAGQSELSAMTDISNQFYDAGVQFSEQTGYSATMTDAAFVTKIYENVLGRTGTLAPNTQEVNYWVTAMNGTNPAETGVTRATVIQRMLSDAKAFANDPTWGWVTKLLENKTTVANFFANQSVSGGLAGADAVLEGKDALAGVTSDPASVTAAINRMLGGNTFTLKEAIVEGESATPDVTAIYWGYTPYDSEVGEGHGIPVAELLKFVTTITGLDLHELGLIDDDGVGPFDNVTNLKLEFGGNISADDEAILTIEFADGTQTNAEVALGEAYFDFLNGLIFDENGNSRLFEHVVTEGEEETSDHQVPIVLTPILNNGGTVEIGTTTSGNDTIVAGRLDLLHGAYIDGGAGYNLLEIDAKGAYAQPLQLLNIQEIHVSDQPNFYTGEDGYSWEYGSGEDNLYSTYPDPTGTGTDDSWIDLSRATKIQKLVVNDLGNSESSSDFWDNYSGDLTIVGVRNGALLRLEGAFTSGSTNIHYGQGLTGTLNVELALGDVTEDINILQNAAVMDINSTGVENHMHAFFAGGDLSRMIVRGTGLFGVDENLQDSFNAGRQAIIDASANTGGLDVTLNGHANVKITGTAADDEIESTGSGASSPNRAVIVAGFGNNLVNTNDRLISNITAGFGDDTITSQRTDDVLIVAGDGNNNIDVDGSRKVSITTGVGNDTIKSNLLAAATTASATINAGAGNNVITANSLTESGTGFGTSTVTITTGGGNDNITALLHRTATITADDGTNVVNVRAANINVTTGVGNDTVTIVGMNTTFDEGDNGETDTVIGGGADNVNNDDNYGVNAHFKDTVAPGALLNIVLGAGSNTLNLGADRTPTGGSREQHGVTALEGSVISSTGTLKIFVENHSDLTQASLTGVTSVVLKQELRITSQQFQAIGAANFSVQFDEEGATEDLWIVVSQDTDMSTMLDALPASVRVHVELHNGATLTIDAEDLHTHFAEDGIDSTDGLNGQIVINNAGLAFNPFENGADHQVIDGGTLSDAWSNSTDVTINRTVTGFNRPSEDDNVDITVLNSTGTATLTVTEPIVLGETGNPTVLQIIGNQDIVFAPGAFIDLGDGEEMGNTIDFSALDGTITGMVVMNFDNITGGIFGNSTGTRVEVGLSGDLGDADQGLISSGVETIVVTSILDNDDDDGDDDEDTATIWLCDDSQDLELIGLQGNVTKTLTINEVPWGLVHPTILLEGDGSVDWDDNLKANGSPETSNIGNIEVNYYIAGAPANILIRNEGGADLGVTTSGTERKFAVGSITVSNAATMNIDVEDGDATIASISGDGALWSLDIDATEDVTVSGELPNSLTAIDVSGVLGSFTGTIDPNDDFTFEGAAGGSTLTIADDFTATSDTTIDGGTAGVALITADDTDVDLSDAELINVTSIFVGDDGELHLTIDQALEIGPENISTDGASLVLSGLGEDPFSLADFDDDFDISVELDVIDQTTVTLDPATDLSGISTLLVPEGVTLVLSAEQFQQLTGAGAIEGVDGTNDFSVVITDLDAASVEGGIDLSGIDTDDLTVQVSENVTLDDDDDLNGADLELADGVTMSLFLAQVDGVDVTGTNTTLQFLDRFVGAGADFDASGWSVDVVMLLNLLVANRNVDLILNGIQESVEKVIYNGIGTVDGVTQTVTITAGTTIPGFVVFNPISEDVEIQNFVLNMSGGTEISGNLRLSTTDKEDDFGDQIRTYLETVTINSTGTAENILSGDTANVITGDLTSQGTGVQFGGYTSIDNELLDVQITATQDLVIEGDIVFESENGQDDFSGNDVNDAVAEVLVNGTADVEFGIDSSDSDVDGVVVTNAGTGTVLVGMDDGEIDSGDDLTFTGTGDIDLFIEDGSTFDLSDDDLSAVDEVFMDGNATVTVTLDQFLAIGVANFIPDNDDFTTGTINIVGVGSDPFDATGVNEGIVIGTITTLPGSVTLDPTTNLTGVTEIIVPEGGTLTLSAAQYQQLFGSGTITGVEADGDPTSNFTVNITGLTQALVNHNESAANGNGDGFDITGITADTKTITLSGTTVTLTEADVALGDVSELTFNLATGQELIFESVDQVSPVTDDDMSVPGTGVTVNGDANTTATFFFDSGVDADDTIDASGINTAVLKMLQGLVNNQDVELLQNIGEEVLVVIIDPEDSPGNVLGIDREVVVEAGVTVDGNLIFNDYQDDVEIRNLDLTLSGDSEIDGNLRLTTTDKDPTLTQHFLDSLTIRSEGTDSNLIDGNVSPFVIVENTIGTANSEDNELLVVNVVADADLEIDGDVQFSSLDTDGDADTATFTVSGTADVTIDHLDISEGAADDSVGTDGIGTLVIANNMTGGGTLTVVGGTAAILGSSAFETLTITGTGNTVLGTDPDAGEDGIESASLSAINASGSSGALTIGSMLDIDSQNFVFTSGTGVTMVSLNGDELDEDVTADTGWTFNFTNAAVGSQLHLGSEIEYWEGQLTFNMGANGTLFIDNTSGTTVTVDLTDDEVFLTYTGAQSIVLADGVTLVLRADQADGLNIVAGPNTNDDLDSDYTGVVNIVGLENDEVYDFGGIVPAGTITLAEDDVTVEAGTDLGTFSITLEDLDGDSSSLGGQTIRFSTEAQATRDIIVIDTGGAGSSTNVVWLFNSIAAVGGIDTSGYDGALGRLWFYADLLASEGGDVEQLFTTLPNTILRVDIETLAELNILLQSQAVNRVMEIVHFATVGNLTFSDMGVDPEEHLESLTLHLGGETTVGNIVVNDVVADPLDTDLSTIDFDFLTIVSHRAVRTGDLLASELFVNDNDGTPEPVGSGVENVQPDNINTVGNISVGAGNSGIDLVQVNIDTLGITTLDDSSAGDGANIDIGTITFGYTDQDGAGSDPATTGVTLDVTGDNDINIAAVVATDADITGVTVDSLDFTGVLTAPGASPAVQLGVAVETLTFDNDLQTAGTITLGSATNAGVSGTVLSLIDADDFGGELNLGTISVLDGTDDGGVADDPAFTFNSGTGITTLTIDAVTGQGTPTLTTDSEWVFDFSDADAGPNVDDEVSYVRFGDGTVFQTDAILTFIDAPVVIDGTIDWTQIDINASGTTRIQVPAGSTLILDVAQLTGLGDLVGVEIWGSGTLEIVGDMTNVDLTNFDIRTVNVDLSGVDFDDTLDTDVDLVLNSLGAIEDDGNDSGFNVLGSPFDDNLVTFDTDDTMTGGAGDDTLNAYDGNDTYFVNAGTDTIFQLNGDGLANSDILVVSAGATADAEVANDGDADDDFIATAATTNAGTANLTLEDDAGEDGTIDMTLAGGPNGYHINGQSLSATGEDTLIGSAFADTVNGGNDDQAAGGQDVLTGNGGGDVFQFNVLINSAATLTVATTQAAIDREIITLSGAGTNALGESVDIDYTLNSTPLVLSVDLAAVDTTSLDAVGVAIATAFDALPSLSATYDATTDVVTVAGVAGRAVEIGVVTFNNGGTLAGVSGEGTDVEQITTLTVTGVPTDGDVYNIETARLIDGTITQGTTTASADTENTIAQDLSTGVGGYVSADITDTWDTVNVVEFEAVDADEGGFTLTTQTTAAFGGSGASDNGANDIEAADIVTDFNPGADTLQFLGLSSGVGNLVEAAAVALFATARADADTALDGTTMYYLTSLNADAVGTVDLDENGLGILFFDGNLDGNVDGMVLLPGVNMANFGAGNIIAG